MMHAIMVAALFAGSPTRAQTTQTPTTRPDSTQRLASRDSAIKQKPDSIQAPIGRTIDFPSLEIGDSYTLTRDQFFRSGALTLIDLLARIPGMTTYTTGFLPAPQLAAYAGDFGRLRVFYDGVELDDLDDRTGGIPDLKAVPLWSLEQVTITRDANEVRVDVSSWQYNKTTPYTRFDLLTGDLNTTVYRVFYGKRYYNGANLQIAGEQFSVTNQREGGGGDQISLFGRYGIAKRHWSFDLTVVRDHDTRTVTQRRTGFGQSLPNLRDGSTLAYLRAALGNVNSGPFVQLIASTQSRKETSSHFTDATAAAYGFPSDTVDSAASVSQYIAMAGYIRGPLALRVADRIRTRLGARYNSPEASVGFTTHILAVSGLAEHDAYRGYDQIEGGARVTVLPFLAFSGSVGQRTADRAVTFQPDSRIARIEAGLHLNPRGLWLSGGLIARDTTILIAPIVFDSAYRSEPIGRTTGTTVSLRGPVWKGFSADGNFVHWNTLAAYLPQNQGHFELPFYTQWLSKFPSGNFSFRFVPMYDYRSRVAFLRATDFQTAASSKIISLLVEIRILRGEITYQRRNTNLILYDQVPGYLMPRGTNLYGVRWYFFN